MTTNPLLPALPARRVPPRGGRRVIGALVVASALGALGALGAATLHALQAPEPGSGAGAAATTSSAGRATGLDPELERRLAQARAAANADGVELTLTSGWRSAADQQALVDSTVERYGSVQEAHRWVLPPEASQHVTGLAVDVGPADGALWLEQHGAQFGLCRTYANEPWHFEPVTEPGGTCPPMHEDASHGWG